MTGRTPPSDDELVGPTPLEAMSQRARKTRAHAVGEMLINAQHTPSTRLKTSRGPTHARRVLCIGHCLPPTGCCSPFNKQKARPPDPNRNS
jgi:hypothetical protein